MPRMNISRSIEIKAPREKVYKHLNDFNEWIFWSPWLLMEPEAKVNVSADAKSYSWEGDRIGSGNMKVLDEKENESIDFDLNFLKPWKSTASTGFKLEETNDGTKVTWNMDSGLPFFLFWMKKMMKAFVGADYERGLDMLKAYVEDGKVPSDLEFKGEKQFEGCKWVGVKTDCSIDLVGTQMQADFAMVRAFSDENKDKSEGKTMTIYHKWDIPNGKVLYTAAIEFTEIPDSLPNAMISGEIPSTKVFVLRHVGRYQHLGNAWSTLYAMVRNKELKTTRQTDAFELYVNDPQVTEEKDLITDIYMPIK